ncbi:daunorubicin resistance protein DrrC, partial [Amycolatopsis thailandensis]
VGTSGAFSFNLPEGMCPECEGLGKVSTIDIDQLVDKELSLDEGAITVPNFAPGGWYWKGLAESGFVDPAVKLKDYTPQQWEDFMHKPATKIKLAGINTNYEGLLVKVQRLFLSKDKEATQPHIRAFVDRAITFRHCPSCDGARLNQAALSSKIDGLNIADCSAMQISDLADVVRKLDDPSVAPLLETLRGTLDSLVEIGLGYLSLDRESGTLSGGEAQRVKMVRHLGS